MVEPFARLSVQFIHSLLSVLCNSPAVCVCSHVRVHKLSSHLSRSLSLSFALFFPVVCIHTLSLMVERLFRGHFRSRTFFLHPLSGSM